MCETDKTRQAFFFPAPPAKKLDHCPYETTQPRQEGGQWSSWTRLITISPPPGGAVRGGAHTNTHTHYAIERINTSAAEADPPPQHQNDAGWQAEDIVHCGEHLTLLLLDLAAEARAVEHVTVGLGELKHPNTDHGQAIAVSLIRDELGLVGRHARDDLDEGVNDVLPCVLLVVEEDHLVPGGEE